MSIVNKGCGVEAVWSEQASEMSKNDVIGRVGAMRGRTVCGHTAAANGDERGWKVAAAFAAVGGVNRAHVV